MKEFIIGRILSPGLTHAQGKRLITRIIAYHDGNWHLTEHIPAVSTSYCDTMHTMLACALFHTMKLSAFNVQPKGILHDVLINLLYRCQGTPLHQAHSCPLLPIIFQKHFKSLKSFRTNPPTRHPTFKRLPSAASKTKIF